MLFRSAGGHALSLLGGTNNTITSAGTLTTTDGQTGLVIEATGGGNNTIVNSGLIVGSVDLGSGNNTLTNVNGGVFLAGPIVNLGTGTFVNSGIIAPGGANNVATLAITGGLTTSATSQYFADLNLATNLSDKLTITQTASLSGTVIANIMNPGYAQPGSHDATIVSATGGITSTSGLHLTAPVSAVATFSLSTVNPTTEALHYVINFDPAGLTATQQKVGTLINRIQTAGTPSFRNSAASLFSIQTVGQLGSVYDSLSGQGATAAQTATLSSIDRTQNIVDDEMSLLLGPDAPTWSPNELGRPWIEIRGGSSKLDGTDGTAKVTTRGYQIAAGWDVRPTAHSLIGFTLGGDPSDRFSVSQVATAGKVHGFAGGVYGGLTEGAWTGRVDLLYGHHRFRYNRSMVTPGDAETATGGSDGDSTSLRAKVSRQVQLGGDVRWQPFFAVDVTHLSLGGYTEASKVAGGGAGFLNLAVSGRSFTDTRTFLGSDMSGSVQMNPGYSLVSSARVSWVHDFYVSRTNAVAFAGASDFLTTTSGAPAVRDAGRLDLKTTLRSDAFELRFSVGAYLADRINSFDTEIGARFRW